ncbi:MAG: N-acetylglucosamine-6-phosphate deacetylase [Clostridia bacterium]|nr:N-acetylglucosamine-6-phosphate deacetylase [Clostridia bacterium]
MTTLFKNFKIIKNGKIDSADSLTVKDGVIASFNEETNQDIIIDGRNELFLSAGFIDLHTHGAAGFDFMDADAFEYNSIAKCHAMHGATALYPTTVAASKEELISVLEAFNKAKKKQGGARLLGIHLEGPYISPNQNGALDKKYIRDAKPEEYVDLFSLSNDIKRMTVAPEIEGVEELGKYMMKNGIVGSIGHTNATYSEVLSAYENGGYRLMTHFYSCMSSLRRHNGWRIAGCVEAGYLLNDMMVEVICDGCHLPSEFLRLILKVKGAGNIILVTDSMRAAGAGEGVFHLGSRKNGYDVTVEDGVAKLMDRSAFAGSVATPDRLVRTMSSLTEATLAESVMMITENPAKAMHIDNEYGFLEVGRKADLTVFNENVDIKLTMVDGEIIYRD